MERIAHQIGLNGEAIQNYHIVGLARGWGWPALIDFESKIVEGGICTIEMSELKNFTHGRYVNTYGRENRKVMLFKTPKDDELVQYLKKRFKNRVENYLIETERDGIIGALELIIKSIYLAYYLGYMSNKDITKPKYPPEARGLYGWEPEYRKGMWKSKKEKRKRKIIKTKL